MRNTRSLGLRFLPIYLYLIPVDIDAELFDSLQKSWHRQATIQQRQGSISESRRRRWQFALLSFKESQEAHERQGYGDDEINETH